MFAYDDYNYKNNIIYSRLYNISQEDIIIPANEDVEPQVEQPVEPSIEPPKDEKPEFKKSISETLAKIECDDLMKLKRDSKAEESDFTDGMNNPGNGKHSSVKRQMTKRVKNIIKEIPIDELAELNDLQDQPRVFKFNYTYYVSELSFTRDSDIFFSTKVHPSSE